MKKLVSLAVACASSMVWAARTVDIASNTGESVLLAFGPSDGRDYQLCVGYGAQDSEGIVTAWQTFEKVADVPADATDSSYALPAGWGDTVKAARFFLVEQGGRVITSEWWRITFTENVYSGYNDIQLGDLRFYDNLTDLQSGTDMAQGLTPGSGSDPAELARGKVITTLKTTMTKPAGASCNLWDIRNAFDNSVFNAVYAPCSTALSSNPQSVTWRLAEGRNRVQCYKVFSSYLTWYLHPCSWKVEVSDDGRNWTLIDVRTGQRSSSGGVSLGGSDPYIPNVPVVASQTESLKAMNVLVVEEGHPLVIDQAVVYDEVYLRDKVTLEWSGTIVADRVVVDGPKGGVVIRDNGFWTLATRLVLSASCRSETGYVDIVQVDPGCVFRPSQALNENPDVAARILFNGGGLRCSGFDGKPLAAVDNAKWILEGVDGSDILIGDMGLQRMLWLSGEGLVETRGAGSVVVQDANYNPTYDYRGTVYMNASTTPGAWNHEGDFVVQNAAKVVCQSDDSLPHGAGTGDVRFRWWLRTMPCPLLDLGGKSIAVNGLVSADAPCACVTNSSASAATLVLGRGDVDGVVSNVVLRQASINLRKEGAGVATVLLAGDGESQVGAVAVEAGTLALRGGAGDQLRGNTLTVAAGAELVVDGLTVRVESLSGAGTVTKLNGGRVVHGVGTGNASDTQVLYDPIGDDIDELRKEGASRIVVQQAESFGGDLTVAGGTLVFSGRQCTNEWYRWVLKGTFYDSTAQIALGELYLYPDATKSEHLARGIKPGSSAENLEPGQVVASFSTTMTKSIGANCNLWDIRNLFDDGVYGAVNSASEYRLSANSQTITFRMPQGKNRVGCYLPANSYCTWQYHPSAWDFQTSPDGRTWTTLDSRTGQYLTGGGSLNGGAPYMLKGFLADNAKGLAPGVRVSVAAGAELDLTGVSEGRELSRIVLDARAGGGTIRGAAIAEKGTFYLENVDNPKYYEDHPVALDLDGADGIDNIEAWRLMVNGEPLRNGIVYRDGNVFIRKLSMTIYFR